PPHEPTMRRAGVGIQDGGHRGIQRRHAWLSPVRTSTPSPAASKASFSHGSCTVSEADMNDETMHVTRHMPKIQLQFVSALAHFTKERQVDVELPAGGTIATVLDILHQKYGKAEGARMFENKASISNVLVILVNGTDIRRENGLDTELHEGDVVVFMPVIAGG
ncbi:MAG: MoaD/ThiS family protein, partial [Candidatus Sigynarchaeum springense]